MQNNKFTEVEEEQIVIGKLQIKLNFLLDYEIVERVELFGYPRQFIINSIENYEMNDAGTCYFLLDKDRQNMDLF